MAQFEASDPLVMLEQGETVKGLRAMMQIT